MTIKTLLAFGAVALLMTPVNADAMGARDNNTIDREDLRQERLENRILERIFTDYERDEIEDYFDEVDISSLPPGLAKRDKLPPGLQKQVEKNGQLPPGLAKRALPDDLEDRLPERTENIVRRIIGDDVVLVDEDTDLILDIIRNVI